MHLTLCAEEKPDVKHAFAGLSGLLSDMHKISYDFLTTDRFALCGVEAGI